MVLKLVKVLWDGVWGSIGPIWKYLLLRHIFQKKTGLHFVISENRVLIQDLFVSEGTNQIHGHESRWKSTTVIIINLLGSR